jgi:hypothetical protein
MVYTLLKFVHVTAVIVWVGGVVALAILNARVGRRGDRTTLAVLAGESAFYGRAVVGPAIGVAVAAGLAMVAVAHLRVATLWISWGMVGVVGFLVIGAASSGRAGAELGRLAAAAPSDESRVRVLQRRLAVLTGANLLLLASVVWAMVAKPS